MACSLSEADGFTSSVSKYLSNKRNLQQQILFGRISARLYYEDARDVRGWLHRPRRCDKSYEREIKDVWGRVPEDGKLAWKINPVYEKLD